jgi:hypothetical protein
VRAGFHRSSPWNRERDDRVRTGFAGRSRPARLFAQTESQARPAAPLPLMGECRPRLSFGRGIGLPWRAAMELVESVTWPSGESRWTAEPICG